MRYRLAILAWGVAAAILASCGGGGGGGTGSGDDAYGPNPTPTQGGGGAPADVTITINADMSFSPNPATARVGQTVGWRNSGGELHTATQDGNGFDTGSLINGTLSAPIRMNTAGNFGYHCNFHPTMVGRLNITP